MTQRKLAKVLVFILISVIIVTSSSRLLPLVAGSNFTVSTQWPSRVLDPGQTVSVKVIVKQGVVDAFMDQDVYLMVESVSVWIAPADSMTGHIAYVSRDYNRKIELIGDFNLPISIDANAEPGYYQFETLVIGTIYANLRTFSDSGTIWIREEEERNVTETLGAVSVTIKTVFPTMAEEGETIVGRATIIPDSTIQMMGGVFTLKSSTLTIRPMGISKAIAPAGTTLGGARTFDVSVKVPNGTQPGAHTWIASATATGTALGMEVTRTVTVTGSLIIKERHRPGGGGIDEELDCIIATAAFGSRMDTNVEAMRHLRDNSVKMTFTGGNFMRVFNNWYYSWSPGIAEIIHNNEPLRQVARFVLYPVVGSVMAAQGTYSILSFNGELAATTSILTAAFICGVFYIAPVFLVIRSIKQRLGRINSLNLMKRQKIMLILCAIFSMSLTIMGEIANLAVLNAIGVTVLALTVTLSAAAITVKALTRINVLMKTLLTK
ncbi:CFI-box-CTERM domain-containing protein [Thermoproteota archaeon]